QQGEIPRGDHPDHTDGFADDTGHDACIPSIDETTGVVVGDLAEVAEASNDIVHIALSLDKAFAGVQRLCAGELVFAFPHRLGDLEQVIATFDRWSVIPEYSINDIACRHNRTLY